MKIATATGSFSTSRREPEARSGSAPARLYTAVSGLVDDGTDRRSSRRPAAAADDQRRQLLPLHRARPESARSGNGSPRGAGARRPVARASAGGYGGRHGRARNDVAGRRPIDGQTHLRGRARVGLARIANALRRRDARDVRRPRRRRRRSGACGARHARCRRIRRSGSLPVAAPGRSAGKLTRSDRVDRCTARHALSR